ncbi:hypothetical protein [Oceanicola sp. D3]|uniref:hypothetical protein n=1 Tax=Oceanicola sp. D3 TaxID=2587163 RepID=UPI00143DA3BC|nr:hypothetical protein [Oceanicola sp. D3]
MGGGMRLRRITWRGTETLQDRADAAKAILVRGGIIYPVLGRFSSYWAIKWSPVRGAS